MIRNRMLCTCVALGASVAATGQSREENWDRCTSVNAEISIAGCTALINSGQELPATLSIIHYNLGASFQEKKQYDAALKNFDEAIRLNPNFAQALNGRGAAYLEAGDFAKAIQDFSAALQLNSFYSIAYFNRGRAYSKQGDYDRAIEDYNHDLKLVPTHADALAERGDAYRMKHQDDLALSDYVEALHLDPNLAQAALGRALIFVANGQDEQAISDLGLYLKLKPGDATGFASRGDAYWRQGQYEKAIADYNHALQINPIDSELFRTLGMDYTKLGEYDNAVTSFGRALELRPQDADSYMGRGLANFEKGQYELAIADFDMTPNNQRALFARGCSHLLEAQASAAAEDFRRTIVTDPKSVTSVYAALWLHLAESQLQTDDAAALELAAKATDLSQWPGPVLKMDLRQATDADVVAAAANAGAAMQKKETCEANFYIGEDANLNQLRDPAIARLKAAQDGCAKDSVEFKAAVAELRRLESESL